MLSDSGGFQVLSLANLRKIREEGVTFRSHLDGSAHELSPERAMEIQTMLGVDVMMSFDECLHWPATEEQARTSMERTVRWARAGPRAPGAARGRGGVRPGPVRDRPGRHLRRPSGPSAREALVAEPFDGYSLGGLWVGEPKGAGTRAGGG